MYLILNFLLSSSVYFQLLKNVENVIKKIELNHRN